MNVPNMLTLLRIVLTPTIAVVFYLPGKLGHLLAMLIFMIAAVTDFIDGYLARHWRSETKFGSFLDPVADKLVISVALILITTEIGHAFIALPAAVIICREITISALREWMADLDKRSYVAVSYLGKIKTMAQMLSVTLLLYYCPGTPHAQIFLRVGLAALYLAAGLTILSMYQYLKAAWPDLKGV